MTEFIQIAKTDQSILVFNDTVVCVGENIIFLIVSQTRTVIVCLVLNKLIEMDDVRNFRRSVLDLNRVVPHIRRQFLDLSLLAREDIMNLRNWFFFIFGGLEILDPTIIILIS